MSKYLIDEYPMILLPSLAEKIGLNEAVVLQQIHYWTDRPDVGIVIDGQRWVYNTVDRWRDQFRFWSKRTLERVFSSLKSMGLLVSVEAKDRLGNRILCYRVDYDVMENLDNQSAKMADSGATNCRYQSAKMADGVRQNGGPLNITDTTTETTKPFSPATADEPAQKRDSLTQAGKSLNVETWESYRAAYVARYRTEPLRNAMVNGQIANVVKQAGKRAPEVVKFYLRHNDPYFVRERHPIGALLKSLQRILVDMETSDIGGQAPKPSRAVSEDFRNKDYGVSRRL